MRAKKENKVYDINEIQKEAYLKEGYDIYDNDGKVIEYSPKKVITYNEHLKIIEDLKKANDSTELNAKIDELTKANSDLTKANAELTKTNSELVAKVDELTKANEKLTKNK